MKQRILSNAISIFFLCFFLLGTVFNLFEGDYAQVAGFFLLAVANVLPLRAGWAQREPTSSENTLSNIVGLSGLLLVVLSWVGLL